MARLTCSACDREVAAQAGERNGSYILGNEADVDVGEMSSNGESPVLCPGCGALVGKKVLEQGVHLFNAPAVKVAEKRGLRKRAPERETPSKRAALPRNCETPSKRVAAFVTQEQFGALEGKVDLVLTRFDALASMLNVLQAVPRPAAAGAVPEQAGGA